MSDISPGNIREKLSSKWLSILNSRYPGLMDVNKIGVNILNDVFDSYVKSNLADTIFKSQIILEEGYYYHQRMSELLMHDRLEREGFILSSANIGPDFRGTKDGVVYWFEIITPQPTNEINIHLHDTYRRLNPSGLGTEKNSLNSLLRISSAIAAKKEKFDRYITNGIVGKNDICIIVINDSLLYPLDVYMVGLTEEIQKGVSNLPLAVEAVLGCGGCIMHIDENSSDSQIIREARNHVIKSNGAEIRTDLFLNDKYHNISAILCLTLREDYCLGKLFFDDNHNNGILIFNKNAKNVLPPDQLKSKQYSIDDIKKLMSPSPENPTHLITKTLHGQYYDFINYINYCIASHRKNIVSHNNS